jgi:hypothetical protein
MVKVQLFQQAIEWTDKLAGLQQKVNAKRDQLAAERRDQPVFRGGAGSGHDRT